MEAFLAVLLGQPACLLGEGSDPAGRNWVLIQLGFS